MGPWPDDLPDVDGVDNAPDQVVRRQAFEAAHPEWKIWREGYTWYAEREVPPGDRVRVSYAGALRFLLDSLEKHP